jgi:osmotically-inducible protein OsmY
MKDFFIGLFLGIILTLATVWYFAIGRNQPKVHHAQDIAAATVQQTVGIVDAKLTAWHLTTPEVKAELAATGKVIRRSAREFGAAAAGTASDAAITAKIKAKFIAEHNLSVWNIAINTTEGHVTLAGTIPEHSAIAKAMALALETDGVRDVTSNLQVRK